MAMSKSETITIRVSSDLRAKLELLAESTRRSKSFLAGEAVSRFVESEAEIIDGIKEGLADIDAGRVVPHDQAMKRIRATIANPRPLPVQKSA
jgi:predicted transcriptional regulator